MQNTPRSAFTDEVNYITDNEKRKVSSSYQPIKIKHKSCWYHRNLKSFVVALVACLTVCTVLGEEPPQQPNIIVILADDLGYGDVSFNGCPDYTTPNIDSIASNGVLCTNGYVTHPICSPSRAGLLTGRYQERFGHENQPTVDASNPSLGLPMSETLLPQLLKPAGYVCGAIGKWHLGYARNFRPINRGFDEFFGFLGGSSAYYNAKLLRGETHVTETAYLTDAFTREGVSFINRHAGEPFFLYLAYNAPHAPYNEPPANYMQRVSNIPDPDRQKYAAMIVALDDGVGQVLQALQTNNLLNNTLIFFLSDNGAPPDPFTRNDPFRGFKWNVLEGGIHVPFAVQWNGTLPPHTSYDVPVSSLDIVTTTAAAAGVSLPPDRPYDGVNLIPYLSGQQVAPKRALFWRWFGLGDTGPQGWFGLPGDQQPPTGSLDTIYAVRRGTLKLVTERATTGQPPALYNLANDVGETQDLALSQPGKVHSLKKLYDEWNTQLVPPLWQMNTDFQTSPLVLAGDWNGFNKADSTLPWRLTRITAPATNGAPDGFNWFVSTVHVASAGGDTTPGSHSFVLIGNKSYASQWGGVAVNIGQATTLPFFNGIALGPPNSIALRAGFYYSFRILDPSRSLPTDLKLAVMKTSAPPISVTVSGQSPQTPTSDDPIVVSITTNQPKSAEERIYLRWSTDFFITSNLIEAGGSGLNYSATIPAQPSGTALHYGAVTSTANLSPLHASGAIDPLILGTTQSFKVLITGPTSSPSPTPTP